MEVKVKQKYHEKPMTLQLSGLITQSLESRHGEGELERLQYNVEALQIFCGALIEILAEKRILFTDKINELLSNSEYKIIS